ncbi:MAG: serine/threonine protein kinase [Thaumarchaeota archaeon]|nr:serine/threonine protein kinase [Nitrososphaerota archaeon]
MQESEKSLATQSEFASLDQLTRTPYIRVLTYPKVSLRSARSRIKQLEKLGVDGLVFEGHAKIGRLGILGLGTVGVVVKAVSGGTPRALKVRRTDANRPDMQNEVRIAAMANRLGIGPQVHAHSKDFILMKLLRYQGLNEWLKGLRGPGTRSTARETVHSILNQCRTLDIMGVDHGQLSNLRKHVVMAEGKPWIIDFESASTSRRPKNVTTAAQYLFIGGKLSPLMRRTLGIRDREALIRRLSDYKSDTSDFAYSKLLESLKLVTH